MGREEKKPLNRPSSRKLVRWNENIDELLLLTVQSVCNKEGVRIPWAEVAKTMGNNVTEGAIIQHLAKLRTRRVQKQKEVPPPLRRGGVGSASPSTGSETHVTSGTPSKSREYVAINRAKRTIQRTTKVEKQHVSATDISDSDEEWTIGNSNNKSKKNNHKKADKKRKSTTPERQETIDQIDDHDAVADEYVESDHDTEMVAVGAKFLDFLGNTEEREEPRATPASEVEEDDVDMKNSLVVKLKLGANNLGRLKYKGTGTFHDRDPEQRWELPAPGPDGEKWGFSRDYYGPIPKAGRHSHNPGLLRGEWPIDVVMRQYEAPQAVTWAHETYEPDPRVVHPATYLEDPNCVPQLKLHRKLRTFEEKNADARVRNQDHPGYQAYVNVHRELPSYGDPSWTTAPTVNATKQSDDYGLHSFSTNTTDPSDKKTSLRSSPYQQHNFNDFDLSRPQIGYEMGNHQILGGNHTGIDDHVDRHRELPPENNHPGSTTQLVNDEPINNVDISAFDTDFESFINTSNDFDNVFGFA